MKDEKWGVDPVWCNFRLFDANSLAANQQLSLLYEKLPCLSRIRHAHALHPSSLFLSLSLSLSSIRSLALARNRLFFLLALAPPCSLSSLTTHFVLLFTNFTPPSFFLSPINKRVHLFFFTLGSLDHLFIHERRKCACERRHSDP